MRDRKKYAVLSFADFYMFPSPAGEMYCPYSVVNLQKKFLQDAGPGRIRFHDLPMPAQNHAHLQRKST